MTGEIQDARGRPIRKSLLGRELAAPLIGTMRSPAAGYPADGLTPDRLANILRAADQGQPRQFLELAEQIEEKDPHYQGVLGTRRRTVAQMPISVIAASDDPEDERIAQMVRDYVMRDDLSDHVFHILDCIGKGYSATEVLYEVSEGQYLPRLIHRDPRSFRFDRNDLETPLLIGPTGMLEPLEPGRFIWATIKAKSGLAIRSGLSRLAAWGYMFKGYTQRDWQLFIQTYGQPVRLGKYQSGAQEEDKATLYQAVRDIAGDCAGIIPESMQIEFIESKNVTAGGQLYLERVNWIDQQISKAVLGQTSTTDAVVGGLGSGKEHRAVQKDIALADAKALAGILNRDLVRIWVQLEFGPRKAYPTLHIGAEEEEDLKALSEAIVPLIDRGMEVDMAEMRAKFGLKEPKPGAKTLSPMASKTTAPSPTPPPLEIKRVSGEIKRGAGVLPTDTAPQAQGPVAALPAAPTPEDVLTDRMALEAAPAMDVILAKIGQMMEAATSLDELRQMLLEGFADIPVGDLTEVLGLGMTAANLGGRVAIGEDAQVVQ